MTDSLAIEIKDLRKTYDNGFEALKGVSLKINRGEIVALLGPNGAGKTTLIGITCGLNRITSGQVIIGGYDITTHPRQARSLVGLVPQELTTNAFETVWDTVSFSRGLFGKKPAPAHIEKVLTSLSLWEKRANKIMTLSGGMKRRVLIAKALAHEPEILFLDEPTAGVDVELRKGMWQEVENLRQAGVTIILTTHYIEEAEEMADRIAVINHGTIIKFEEKNSLIAKLGSKELIIELEGELSQLPKQLQGYGLKIKDKSLIYSYDPQNTTHRLDQLLHDMRAEGLVFRDIHTRQSSLEDIFVKLVKG
jgi:ABC-2 type transport system ATP-binding protein